MKILNDDAKLFYKLRAIFGSKWPKTDKVNSKCEPKTCEGPAYGVGFKC